MSSVRVFHRALGGASHKTWILKGTPLFFSAPRVLTCKGMARRRIVKMKDAKVLMTEIICRTIETIAICVVIVCIGCKILDKFNADGSNEAQMEQKGGK